MSCMVILCWYSFVNASKRGKKKYLADDFNTYVQCVCHLVKLILCIYKQNIKLLNKTTLRVI